MMDQSLLRHTLATLAYRGGKVVRGVTDDFATFRVSDDSRTAGQILAHIGDLLEWSLWLADGEHRWRDSTPQSWDAEVDRFFNLLQALDDRLAAERQIRSTPQQLFQGPIADAFTHVGQIAMLRRLAGKPVRGENYFKAEIVAGRVGRDQAVPRREFD